MDQINIISGETKVFEWNDQVNRNFLESFMNGYIAVKLKNPNWNLYGIILSSDQGRTYNTTEGSVYIAADSGNMLGFKGVVKGSWIVREGGVWVNKGIQTISTIEVLFNGINIGGGVEIFANALENLAKFRTLVAGQNITISQNEETITISTTEASGEANTGQNVGDTGIGIFKQKSGVTLQFKKIEAGTGLSISEAGDVITISNISPEAGETNTGQSLGTGIPVYVGKSGVVLQFNSLKFGGSISGSLSNNEITISSTAELNTIANLGVGANIYKEKVGTEFKLRSIRGDSSIIVTQLDDTIDLSFSGLTDLSVLFPGAGITGNSYNGTSDQTWNINFAGNGFASTVARSDHNHTLDSLSNSAMTSKSVNDIVGWNGSNWTNLPYPSGEIVSGVNLGSGQYPVFVEKSGTELRYRRLKPGTGISMSISDTNYVEISASGFEPSITAGISPQYYSWNKTFKQIDYSEIANTPPPVDLSDYATLNTAQTFTAAKVFADPSTISLRYADDSGSTLYTSLDFSLPNQSITGASRRSGTIAVPSLSESYTWTLPTKTGTFAMVSDIPTVPDLSGYVTKDGNETITGLKTFKNDGGLLIKNTAGTVKALKIGVTSTTSEYIGELRYDTIGGNRVWLLPDATGVIALTSDIPSLTKASGVDINTGTDDVKYITSLSIRNSNILSIEKTGQINGMTNKATPVDADSFIIDDSAASYTKKRMLWSSILTTLDNRYFGNIANQYAAITEKTSLSSNDRFVIEDSSNSYAKRMLKWSSIRTVLDNVYYGAVANQFYATTEKTSLSSNDRFVIEDSDATYNKRSVKWNTIVTAIGGGGGATNLDSLTDVTITSVSTGQVLQYNGSQWVNATVSGTSHDRLHAMTNSLDHSMGSGKIIGRITSGTGQPEELSAANVLSFIGVSEAEWKNENITKTHIEAKLTGIITSHTHNYDNYDSWNVSVVGISGTQSISSGGTLTFIGAGGTSISRSGSTITITSSTASGGIPEIPSGTNLNYFRGRDSVGNAAWVLYSAPSTHSAATLSGTISYLTLNSSTQVFTASKVPILDINATGTPSNTTYLRGDGQWATPPGTNYTFSNSILNTSGTVTLVNDSATPGNSKYYGTNSSGVKGWHTIVEDPLTEETDPLFTQWINTSNIIPIFSAGELSLQIYDQGILKYTTSAVNLDSRYYTETEISQFYSGATAITGYNKTNWDTAYGWGNHINLYVPLSRSITINGTTQTLAADRTWNVGTVTSVGVGGGIVLGGTLTDPTLSIQSLSGVASSIGTINVSGNKIGVDLGTTSTTAAAGNHTHVQLHDKLHSITSTTDHTANNWKIFYSNGLGQVTELALSTNKRLLISRGVDQIPEFVDLSSLDVFGVGVKGLVPAVDNDSETEETRFLRADGLWRVPAGSGTGMSNPMTAIGDMIYRSADSNPAALAIGSLDQVLSVRNIGGNLVPVWTTLSSTFVLSVTGDVNISSAQNDALLQTQAINGKTPSLGLTDSDEFLINQSGLKKVTSLQIKQYINPLTSKGDLVVGNDSGSMSRFAANTTSTRRILSQTSSTTTWVNYDLPTIMNLSYGTANQLLKVNATRTALEYFTPSNLSPGNGILGSAYNGQSAQTWSLNFLASGGVNGTSNNPSRSDHSHDSFSKLPTVSTGKLLGRSTSLSAGEIQEITINTTASESSMKFIGTTVSAKLQNESSPTLGGPLNANSNNISLSGNIVPVVDGSTSLKDLGSSSAYWKDIYSKGKIYLAGGTTFYAGDINGSAYFNNISAGAVTARTYFILGSWKFELANSGNTMRLVHNNIIRFEFYSTGDMKFIVN